MLCVRSIAILKRPTRGTLATFANVMYSYWCGADVGDYLARNQSVWRLWLLAEPNATCDVSRLGLEAIETASMGIHNLDYNQTRENVSLRVESSEWSLEDSSDCLYLYSEWSLSCLIFICEGIEFFSGCVISWIFCNWKLFVSWQVDIYTNSVYNYR